MKKSKRVIWLFSLCFFSVIYHASFARGIALEGGDSKINYDFLEKAVSKRDGFYIFNGANSFRVTLGSGRAYYLASSTILLGVKPVKNGYPGGRGYCEFDFYDAKYEYVNGIRVNVRDHADTNVCNWIEGVSAVAYKKKPALLVTVQYHRGIDPVKTGDDIGNNYHDFTALLILDPGPDGSLAIRQDDECLGAMNQIGELAIARKRITECNQ
jgi:hypothetical protein